MTEKSTTELILISLAQSKDKRQKSTPNQSSILLKKLWNVSFISNM